MRSRCNSRFKISLCSFITFSSLCCGSLIPTMAVPVEDPASAASNIFSSPRKGEEVPRYVQRDRQQMNRRLMAEMEGTPGWQELKVLPSLNPEQRKKIHDLFEKSKKEAEPLVQELKDLRQKPVTRAPFGPQQLKASKAPEAFGGGDFRQARIARPDSDAFTNTPPPSESRLPFRGPFESASLPHVQRSRSDSGETLTSPNSSGAGPYIQPQMPFGTQRGPFRMGPPLNEEQLTRVRTLQRDLRIMRQASWDQAKALLTEQNLKDLELMKAGELLPQSLKADSSEPASSSLGRPPQPDTDPMMMESSNRENDKKSSSPANLRSSSSP